MGKVKYKQEIMEFFKRSLVVNIESLKKIVRMHGGDDEYIYLLINNMLKKGEIKRITRGFYTTYEDPVLAVFCFKPAYIGLQDALTMNNLWEQETIPVIVTTRKVRQGTREVLGSNVLIRRISPKYFFGFQYVKQDSFCIPVSDVEKTFIDMIYFKEKLDKEAEQNLKRSINKERLKEYLKKYPRNFRKRILKNIFST